jgi:ATP-binding cassette subfamily B protein
MFTHDKHVQKKRWSMEVYLGGFITLGMLLAMVGGYYLYNLGAITIGQIYMVIFYLNILENPLWALTREVQSFQTIEACIQRLNELLAVQPQIVDGPGIEVPPGKLGLSFENVHFAYEDGESLLTGLGFRLEPGARLGLLGRTGSGKSTLARLALRLYDPQSGEICLDGANLRSPTLAALRQRIGMVTQEVQIFQGTLRDNLTFFDPDISDAQIESAIAALELDEWYRSLPDGLDTTLSQGSQGLSAGEAQLLAFTRILLRNPGLVILDEASSRLDPATERRIERAVSHLLEDRTAIIIAHRLSTVERVDQIMILESGQVLEYGPRQVLADDPDSRFHRLLEVGLEEVLA